LGVGMENSDPLEKKTAVNTLEINKNKLFIFRGVI
jgi:hypothetical protein